MQASVRAVERHDLPTAGAAPADRPPPPMRRAVCRSGRSSWPVSLSPSASSPPSRSTTRSPTTSFWSLAAGQWMLDHHRIIGLDPFSYTEAHRRWVVDEWGSEVVLAAMFRAVGNAAYPLYAVVLGGASLAVSAAYARALGARGGPGRRDRAPAVVWHRRHRRRGPRPRLLAGLVPPRVARADEGAGEPALAALPPTAVPRLGQHARVGPDRARSCSGSSWAGPWRRPASSGGSTAWRSRRTPVRSGWRCSAACSPSCITPYGPGLLGYDVDVSRNGQIGQYINEWNSPDFHSLMVLARLPRPGRAAGRVHPLPPHPAVGRHAGRPALFVEALRTQRLVIYLMLVAVGLAAVLPARRPWGTTARRWAGAGFVGAGHLHPRRPLRAGRECVIDAEPVQAFDYLRASPRPHLHRVRLGRLLHRPAPGHLRRRPHRPLRGHGADAVLRHQRPHDQPGPHPVRLRRRRTSSGRPTPHCRCYLAHDPRWHVVDRSPVALVFART